MVVTFVVFHWERSELNTDASLNAVEVNAMVDPIQKQVKKKKNEEMGKGEKTEFDSRNNERKHKEVQWTYCMTCPSPSPCSTWKDLS